MQRSRRLWPSLLRPSGRERSNLYRTVQECRCGCGRKRALKTEQPVLNPKFHHAEITGQTATVVTPQEMTLEALDQDVVRQRMEDIADSAVGPLALEVNLLEERIGDIEREMGLTTWQRIKRFFGGKP